MKLVTVFSVFLFPLILAEDYTFDIQHVQVPLDHFSYTGSRTFSLKYLVNDTFYLKGGPIFFYTGNEGDIEMFAQNSGFLFDIAPRFKALIVFAEHRYYGESVPFGNLSYTSPEYLGYLSSSQALADFVYLINELQKTYAPTNNVNKTPVVAFGGSYGGMLAAWLKMKYPNSVVGAIASSAPIWMFKDENPCEEFYGIVTSSFKELGGENCVNTIKKSWAVIRFLKPLPANPVKEFCSKINAPEYSDNISLLKAVGEALQIYTNYTGTTKCNDILKTADKLGDSGWGFQNYDWNFEEYSNGCFQQYGVRPRNEDVPILLYGGKDLSTANNIVFSNGRLDPWSGYGVLRNYTSDIIAIVISDGAHHSDLRVSNPNDPESVKNARQIHVNQITKWFNEYYFKH
ncbi:hypothetical protein NQ314_003572 [Rhamnusium bicolor]|uniref:Lysosomal Pro-X carboxypeptidase n=1 Tax=Rhamnusium bicolor TaxID=1586634 RepID=A0AAV8ZN81_9CUCU|nr:hypothetical protein NQ314_003572 [Rhamnusium bicolor]